MATWKHECVLQKGVIGDTVEMMGFVYLTRLRGRIGGTRFLWCLMMTMELYNIEKFGSLRGAIEVINPE